MTIENHTLREELVANISVDQLSYTNDRVGPQVSNMVNALNYLFAALYPQYIGQFATPANLPATATTNDYAFVIDDGDGKSAAYIYVTLDNVNSWVKKYDTDWSVNGLVQDVLSQTFPLYVFSNGRPDGQVIYGGSQTGENLEFNANAADNSGEIVTHNHFTPKIDNAIDLGKLGARFKDLFIAGTIKNGSLSIALSEIKSAIDHVVAIGNPHNTTYDNLNNKIGTVTVNGDATGSVSLASSGDKTLTLTVLNDSHNHTASTINDIANSIYAKVKLILQSSSEITFVPNDGAEQISLNHAPITTAKITDIDEPVAGKFLYSTTGSAWSPKSVGLTLTGGVTGTGSYNPSTEKIEVNTSLVGAGSLSNLSGVDLTNLKVTAAAGNPTVFTYPTAIGHRLQTGDKIKLVTSTYGQITPSIDGVYTVTRINTLQFSIPVTTSVGGQAHYIPENSQLLYDIVNDKFVVRREFEEISHNELSGLSISDDHPQYVNNSGRSGGQEIYGGTGDNQNLTLGSTLGSVKGKIKLRDTIEPFSSGTIVDLGSSAQKFRDIYTTGELKGARVENLAATPASASTNKGRIILNTTEDKLYYDNGVTFKALSSANIPTKLESFSAETTKAVDLNSTLESGKYTSDYSWMMIDATTSELIPAVIARTTSKTLTVTLEVPITGSFIIKGI